MTLRANIFVHRVQPDAVAVIDCCSRDHPTVSVTNDIGNVVPFLYEWNRLAPRDLLVYKDTWGYWDGVWHRDGKFERFELLRCPGVELAISAMRKLAVLERGELL